MTGVTGPSFRCDRCGICCRTHRVPVTDADVTRLREALSPELPPDRFLEWLAPDEVDMDGEPETFVECREGRRLLVLRHRHEAEGSTCVFFDDRKGCTVHPHRPTSCRTYPYEIDESESIQRASFAMIEEDKSGSCRGVASRFGPYPLWANSVEGQSTQVVRAVVSSGAVFRLDVHPNTLCPPETGHRRDVGVRWSRSTSPEPGGEGWADIFGVAQSRKRELERYVARVLDWNLRQKRRRRLGRLPERAERFLENLCAAP